MAYQLIAVDMDGTLLNSKKEITPRTEAAVTAALARGYHERTDKLRRRGRLRAGSDHFGAEPPG